MQNKHFKSGFVSIIGRPNVGKSTLLNQILQEKVVIVSPKAQTTRNKIQGIYTTNTEQIIFIDTPGIHKPTNELGEVMNQFAYGALSGVDLIIYLIDATKPIGLSDKVIIENLKSVKTPIFLIANKVDLVKNNEELTKNMATYKENNIFKESLAISAHSGYQIDLLIELIKNHLPFGPMFYPEDQLLDQPERFVISEIIREKIILNTKEEIPYSVAVVIESFKEYTNLIEIYATIIIEKASQKKIIIGKEGSMIKKIGTEARKEMVKFLNCKVHLELFVKIEKDWRNKKSQLKELGYFKPKD